MNASPILCEWTGEEMRPLGSMWARRADQQWVVGERYLIEVARERSEASHRHEFAWLREAWINLPERLADIYPTPESLRKRALIEAGWYNEEIVDAGSNAAALRVAAFIRGKDDFALVIVRGQLVMIRSAKSQSRRAMNREEFATSKAALMDVIAGMLGVSIEALQQNAERVA